MSVLVVIEHDRGTMAGASLEALAFARSIAEQLGERVEALLIGGDAAGLADVCAAHGAATCHVFANADDYGPELYGAVVAAAAGQLLPRGIVACGTDRGNVSARSCAYHHDVKLLCHQLSPFICKGSDAGLHRSRSIRAGSSIMSLTKLRSIFRRCKGMCLRHDSAE